MRGRRSRILEPVGLASTNYISNDYLNMAHLYMSLSGDRLSQLHTSPVDVPRHLMSVPPSTCPDGGEYDIAELTEFLQETLNVQVFRATITSRQDPAFRLQAVCKIASCNETVSAVKCEAGFYQHQLRHLQGQYVPHLFGLFIGTSTWREIAILVTSDEGRQLGKPLYTLPLQFRCVSELRRFIQQMISG